MNDSHLNNAAEKNGLWRQTAGDSQAEEHFAQLRRQMVERQLEVRDVRSPRVLDAMRKTPRHKFVPTGQVEFAYEDRPLVIGHNQTISQPYIVAIMAQWLNPQPGDKVLEIGAGCGYQAAVLAEMGAEVFAIEIISSLAEESGRRLEALGYDNVHVRVGDGYWGWFEEAPFDGVIVSAAPGFTPQSLKDQLKIGARLVLPVGSEHQRLVVVTRTQSGFVEEPVLDVRFVPMTGEIARHRP